MKLIQAKRALSAIEQGQLATIIEGCGYDALLATLGDMAMADGEAGVDVEDRDECLDLAESLWALLGDNEGTAELLAASAP